MLSALVGHNIDQPLPYKKHWGRNVVTLRFRFNLFRLYYIMHILLYDSRPGFTGSRGDLSALENVCECVCPFLLKSAKVRKGVEGMGAVGTL